MTQKTKGKIPGKHGPEPTRCPRPTSSRCVLLVEFVTDERWVFASRAFPFIQGACNELGIPVRWLWFGAQMVTEKGQGATFTQHVSLSESELATLGQHVAELQPTHVLLSHDVSLATRQVVTGGAKRPKLLSMADSEDQKSSETLAGVLAQASGLDSADGAAEGEEPKQPRQMLAGLAEQTDWILYWLDQELAGHPKAGAYFVDAWEPDYACVACNDMARAQRPFLLVLGGITCDYRGSLEKNDTYRGVDLSECNHDFGCAFCTWYRGPASDLHRDPVEGAMRQVRRILATAGENGRFRGRVQWLDVRLISRLPALTQAILALNMPPTRFYFEPRADRVVQVQAELEQAVATLAAAGHSVELLRMGAENLVEEENLRLNKGISLEQQDQAMELLKRLRLRHPDHFEYDPTWGYITCTPWTTLDMYQLGVQRAMDRGFDPLGVWLYTPLLLFWRSPILALARQEEGLLCDQWEDIAHLYQPAANNVPDTAFQPWRFRDPNVATVFALSVRFCAAALRSRVPDTLFRSDALYRTLLASPQLGDQFARPDLFTLEVIKAVREAGAEVSRALIMEQAITTYTALVSPEAPPQSSSRTGDQQAPRRPMDRQEKLTYLVEAVRSRFPRFQPITSAKAWEEPGPKTGNQAMLLRLAMQVGTIEYDLRLVGPLQEEKSYFKTRFFSVSHLSPLPFGSDKYQRLVIDFVMTLESALEHHAKELLP